MTTHKPRKYEIKHIFLETLTGYVEASKCKTLDKFGEEKTKYVTAQDFQDPRQRNCIECEGGE
jgi:hypothetical protein